MNAIYAKKAAKFIEKLDAPTKRRIKFAIENLPNGDTKDLIGKHPLKRLRVGKYRVIYQIKGDMIYIYDINSRGDIYKGGF